VAYISSKQQRDDIKMDVFASIAPGSPPMACGREIYRVRITSVHARYCAPGTGNYKFNINPNTLRADYELWICGNPKHWYLIPSDLLRQIYKHPAAYCDSHHSEIRVVSVNAGTHKAGYAAPSITFDLSPYFGALLHV